jgi:hypothetical protein
MRAQRPQVHAHHVVGEALGDHEQPAVELLGIDRVDAVAAGHEAADLALEQFLPRGPAWVVVAVEAGGDAADSPHRLLQHRHFAADAPEPLAQQPQGAPLLLLRVQAQDLADLPERGGVDAVRQQPGVAVGAAVVTVAGGDGGQEARRRAVASGHREGAGREQTAVVVGASCEALAPGRLPVGLDAPALGHRLHLLGSEPGGDGAQETVAAAGARPVAAFEDVEQQEHPLHGLRRELPAHVEQGVREVVGDRRLAQDSDEVVDVLTRRVRRCERRFVDAQCDHVDAYPVFREPAVQLGTEERAGQVGDRQRAREGVVIGDRDEVHAARTLRVVELQGVGERLRAPKRADPRVARCVGVPGVDVKVGSEG